MITHHAVRPKRSTLKSRSEVDLNRTHTFKHSKKEWTGIPIVVCIRNMDEQTPRL